MTILHAYCIKCSNPDYHWVDLDNIFCNKKENIIGNGNAYMNDPVQMLIS